MIHFRLQLLLNYSFGNDTGVAQVSHRDNRSYRFGLLFGLGRAYTACLLSERMHAAISHAAGVGGTSAPFSGKRAWSGCYIQKIDAAQSYCVKDRFNGEP